MLDLTFSRRLAMLGGVMLPLLETARRWRELPGPVADWPFWLDDYLIGALLIAGAIVALRSPRRAGWLTAAWGFAIGMGFGSTMAQYDHMMSPELGADPSGMSHAFVIAIKAALVAIAFIGLLASLTASPSATSTTSSPATH